MNWEVIYADTHTHVYLYSHLTIAIRQVLINFENAKLEDLEARCGGVRVNIYKWRYDKIKSLER